MTGPPEPNVTPPKPPQPMLARPCRCPGCGAGVTVKAWGQSLSVVCQACGRVLDLANAQVRVLHETHARVTHPPVLPLGHRGKLNNISWEIIGYLCREDVKSHFHWREYLLFNPYRGYCWLVEARGHWSVVEMKKSQPPNHDGNDFNQTLNFQNKPYKLYHQGRAKVVEVLGEFYWQVKVGDTVKVADYICPPYQLSAEKDASEWVWSVSTYLSHDDLIIQMGLDGKNGNPSVTLPVAEGIAPHQPSPYQEQKSTMLTLWGVFATVIVVLQLGHLVLSKNQLAHHGVYSSVNTEFAAAMAYGPAGQKTAQDPPEVTTPRFQLPDGPGNVRLDILAPLTNQWLDVDGELVNEQTGERFEFNKAVEYYRGVDDGEAWSEGSQQSSDYLHSVPAGPYHLAFEHTGSVTGVPFQVSVYRSVPTWLNMLLALLFVSINPLIFLMKNWQFEVSRWADSLYSPYASAEENDDDD